MRLLPVSDSSWNYESNLGDADVIGTGAARVNHSTMAPATNKSVDIFGVDDLTEDSSDGRLCTSSQCLRKVRGWSGGRIGRG